eukprot:3620914-Alexandrium_andersonii.AAC.1
MHEHLLTSMHKREDRLRDGHGLLPCGLRDGNQLQTEVNYRRMGKSWRNGNDPCALKLDVLPVHHSLYRAHELMVCDVLRFHDRGVFVMNGSMRQPLP